MVTTELTDPKATRRLLGAGVAIAGTTAAAAALTLLDPSLAPSTRPHPTLTGSIAEAASILENNARVLAAPFLLIALRLHHTPWRRTVGDLLIGGVIATNTIPVGIELGRWQTQLIPYLPHLPLEWAALTTSTVAWLTVRNGHTSRGAIALLAVLTTGLGVAGAAVETWCTPHRNSGSLASERPVTGFVRPTPSWVTAVGIAADFAPPAARPLQGRKLPSPHHGSVPLGRQGGADRAHVNHRPPQGGITQMNSVNLVARLAADPDSRQTDSGTITRLRVAVQRPRKNGEDRGADFVDVTVFGTLAENCSRYLQKGRRVAITGRLRHSEWEGENGRRQRLEVIGETVEFLDSPRTDTDEPAAVEAAA